MQNDLRIENQGFAPGFEQSFETMYYFERDIKVRVETVILTVIFDGEMHAE